MFLEFSSGGFFGDCRLGWLVVFGGFESGREFVVKISLGQGCEEVFGCPGQRLNGKSPKSCHYIRRRSLFTSMGEASHMGV